MKIELFPKKRSLPNNNRAFLISFIMTFIVNVLLFYIIGALVWDRTTWEGPILFGFIAATALLTIPYFWNKHKKGKRRKKR